MPSTFPSYWAGRIAAAALAIVGPSACCRAGAGQASDAVTLAACLAGDADALPEPEFQPLVAVTPVQYLHDVHDPAQEYERWETPDGPVTRERLIDRVTDPTSWIMDMRYQHSWNWPVSAGDPDSQTMQFRGTMPFRAFDHVNLMRVEIPYSLQGTGESKLQFVEIYDFVIFDEGWGRWGVGPSIRMNPNSDVDEDNFEAGPAGIAVGKNKYWTYGVQNKNYLSGTSADADILPILAYKFNDRWAVTNGEMHFVYDWKDSRWDQLPLGIELDYIADVFGQKMKFYGNPQYNFQDDASNSGWTMHIGIMLLIPEA